MSTEQTRFDEAVGIILDSGLLDQRHIEAFWAFCDGEMSEDEFRAIVAAHR